MPTTAFWVILSVGMVRVAGGEKQIGAFAVHPP
jgi:hypothetical protein